MFPHWHIPQISSEFFGVFAISIFPSVCRIHKMARLPPPLKELFSSSIMQIAITSWATTQIFKTFAAIAHCGSTCCTSALPIGQVLFSALPYLYFVRHGRVLSLYPLKPEDNQKGCLRTLACVLLSCASHPVRGDRFCGHLSFSDSYVYSVFKVPVIHYFWRYDRGFSLVGFPIPWNCVAHPIFFDCVSRNSQNFSCCTLTGYSFKLQRADWFVDIHRCDHLSIASRIVVYIYYTGSH